MIQNDEASEIVSQRNSHIREVQNTRVRKNVNLSFLIELFCFYVTSLKFVFLFFIVIFPVFLQFVGDLEENFEKIPNRFPMLWDGNDKLASLFTLI